MNVGMSDWDEIEVGDICRIEHGYPFKGEFFSDTGYYLVLSPRNFHASGGLQIRDGKEVFYSGDFPAEYLLDQDDLLIAMTDLKQDAPILGSVLRVPESGRFLHNQRLGRIEDVVEGVDRDYLYYRLNDQSVRWWLRATATGSTVRHTAPERIYRARIQLPPIAIQQSIGVFLRSVDDLIENSRRRIAILEEIAQLLYQEWFVHFRLPCQTDVGLMESNLGQIPIGWSVRSFSELADFVNGFAFKPSHWLKAGLPIVKIKELKDGVTAGTPRYHGEDIDPKYFIDDGSVLFSWSADLQAYVWSSGPALLNQHLFSVRPYDVSELFVFHSLRARMDEFRARAQGTTMKHIKRSALREVELVLPPAEARDAFERVARPMLDLELNLSAQIRVLREARDLLLPRLMSGEVDVSEHDLCWEAVQV